MEAIATLCDSFLNLEATVKTDLIQLRSDSFDASDAAGIVEIGARDASDEKRAKEIELYVNRMADCESRICALAAVVRTEAKAVAARFNRGEIMNSIELPSLAELCMAVKAYEISPFGKESPFALYDRAVLQLDNVAALSRVLIFLHRYSATQVAQILSRFGFADTGSFSQILQKLVFVLPLRKSFSHKQSLERAEFSVSGKQFFSLS